MKRFLKRMASLALACMMLFMAGGLAEDVSNAVQSMTLNAKVDYMGQQLNAALTLTEDEDGCSVLKFEGTNFADAIASLLVQIGADTIVIDTGDGAIEISPEDVGEAIGRLMSEAGGASMADYAKFVEYANLYMEQDAQYIATILSGELGRVMVLCMQKGLLTYAADGSIAFAATLAQLCEVAGEYLKGLASDAATLSILKEMKLWEVMGIEAEQLEAMLPALLTSAAEQLSISPDVSGEIKFRVLANGNITLIVDLFVYGTTVKLELVSDANGLNVAFNITAGENEYLKAELVFDGYQATMSVAFRDSYRGALQADLSIVDGVGKGSIYTYEGNSYYSYGNYAAYGDIYFDFNEGEFSLKVVDANRETSKLEINYMGGVFDFECVKTSSYGELEFSHKLNIADNRLLYKGIFNDYYLTTVDVSAVVDDENVYADVTVFNEKNDAYVSGTAQYNVDKGVLTFDLSVLSGDAVFVSGRFDKDAFNVTIRQGGTEAKVLGTYSYSYGSLNINGIITAMMAGQTDEPIEAGDFSFQMSTSSGLPLYNLSFKGMDVPENPTEEIIALESYFDGKTWHYETRTNGVVDASVTANIVNMPNEKGIEIIAVENGSVSKIVAGMRDVAETGNGLSATLFLEQYLNDESVGAYTIPFEITMADNNHMAIKADLNAVMYGTEMNILGIDISMANELAAPVKHVSGMTLSADDIYMLLSTMLG